MKAMGLTFSLRDRAADGGAGGGDGAHRRAHAICGVHPGHGRRVGHPRGRVNGPDWLTCWIKRRVDRYLNACMRRTNKNKRWTLTPWQSKATPRVWVPALGHSQSNGTDTKTNRDNKWPQIWSCPASVFKGRTCLCDLQPCDCLTWASLLLTRACAQCPSALERHRRCSCSQSWCHSPAEKKRIKNISTRWEHTSAQKCDW